MIGECKSALKAASAWADSVKIALGGNFNPELLVRTGNRGGLELKHRPKSQDTIILATGVQFHLSPEVDSCFFR